MNKPAIDGGVPIRKEFLVFGKPYIGEEEIEEVIDSLRSGWIGTGPKVKIFENDIKNYIGCKHSIAVNSCTAALHLSLLCNGISKGDEVISTSMTFAATINVIEHVGAKPVFVDIEEDSYNIDAEKIQDAITSRTKAIIPVHFAGLPCQIDEIYKIAEENNIIVIEDAAHAVGAEFNSKKIGSNGNPTCFSFYPTKNITSIEGGMVCLNNDKISEDIKIYSNHGQDKSAWQRFEKGSKKTYDIIYPGFKYNMSDINAAIAIHQLKKIDQIINTRTNFAKIYFDAFENFDLIELPPNKKDRKNVWHLFPILLNLEKLNLSNLEFINAMDKEGIGTGVHYKAIHEQPFYAKKYRYAKGSLKRTEYVSERTVSLPLQTSMNEEDLKDVIISVKKILNYYKK